MNPAVWLTRAAQRFPTAPALLRGETIVADYREFARRAAAIAGALKNRHGIEPGDRVAFFMPNRTEYLELLYGTWMAGGVVLPINYKLHPREAAWIVGNASAKLFVIHSDFADAVDEAMGADKVPTVIVDADEFASYYTAAPIEAMVERGPSDIAWLFYTSGTTGRPKGVMITNANLEAMTLTYFADVDTVTHADSTLYAAPISHAAGLYNFMFVIKGARHVVPESGGFDPAEIAALAPRLGNMTFFAAPTMVHRLVGHAKSSGYDGAGIKTVVYGGGPMYVADILEAGEVMGPHFAQIYGQGESPMTITAMDKDAVADRSHPRWRERLATVGTADSCVEVCVVDEDGAPLPVGEIGEITVRGTSVMAGYWQNLEATEKTIRDGWLWTGDVGALDADGFLTLHDRSKDMIISGGTNIYPREVEEVLLTHPAVAQVSVIGRPDPEWGELVVAYVVAKAGHEVREAELDRHCLDNIARFKRPKAYVFLADLPKNAYGKVLKTALRDMDGQAAGTAG